MNVLDQTVTDDFAIYNGDSAEVLKDIPDNSVNMSMYSPPFLSLFTYSASDRDLGNSLTPENFWEHFKFITAENFRVMKPGRNTCVHVAQVASTLNHDGVIGLKDFRGETIRHYVSQGFIFHGEITVDKCPQAQAIRTKSKALLFVQLRKDSSWLRTGLADYILVFRKPGENQVPILPDISNDEWIEWARPIWYNIRESLTLNASIAKEDKDERHCCPLQLETIERCVRLWSNAGETILSPFAGIGSEGFKALQLGRKFIGVELKPSYYQAAVRNLHQAVAKSNQNSLMALMEDESDGLGPSESAS